MLKYAQIKVIDMLPDDLKSFRADRISVMQRTIDALCIALAIALMAAGVFLALALEKVS